jgi:xylan 1,4-beta-xylosidase
MNYILRRTILLLLLINVTSTVFSQVKKATQTTVCNPVNLSYRFMLNAPSRREAADPNMLLFKGEYYLFASKSGGYFHSKDMINWDLITTTDLPLEDYAPAAVVLNGEIYFMASGNAPLKIYKTADPKSGKWEVFNAAFPITMIDPDFYVDTDGRLYFYYGCSNVNPLYAVELDVKTFNPIGKPVEVLNSKREIYGWERKGDYNEIMKDRPWIEGSWTTKHNGKYYLQYSGPGTEYKSYSDAVYEADKPLGPFTMAKHNPISYKPEGFAASAGHSNTYQDNFGNYWHVSTMTISQKHMFERRLGIFPTFFDKDGVMYVYTGFGDFPYKIPTKKISSPEDLSTGWMLLSYNKPVQVSSEQPNHPKNLAVNEDIRTFWSAKTGDKGEWISVDLEKASTVNAVQINYYENESKTMGRMPNIYYQYLLEYSTDNKNWKVLEDKTTNKTDVPHDYVELKTPVKARYIRLTNYKVPDGTFALAGLRVFGKGPDKAPSAASNLKIKRNEVDRCIVDLNWDKPTGATGYNIRYGSTKDKLYQNYQVLGADALTIRSLNAGLKYYFTIDTFNEGGVTKGTKIIEVN